MKRFITLLLTLLLTVTTFAFAEDIDLSKYSDLELTSLKTRIELELKNRTEKKDDSAPASDFI